MNLELGFAQYYFSINFTRLSSIYFAELFFFILLPSMKIVPNRIIVFLAVLFLHQTSLLAQNDPPPPPTFGPPPPPGLPLDGFIYLLVILSLCFGIYKLNKLKKASN
jgi:hypothetical protein